MSISRRTFSLLLAMTPGVVGRSLVKVLTRNDLLGRTPEEFLGLSMEAYMEEYKLSRKAAQALCADPRGHQASVEAIERRLNGLGVTLVTSADAHYPALIEEMDPDPPAALWACRPLRQYRT